MSMVPEHLFLEVCWEVEVVEVVSSFCWLDIVPERQVG